MKLRIVTCVVALMSTAHADFVTGTLVQIPGSQVCVERLKKGDTVIGYDKVKAKLIVAKVQHLSKSVAGCYYEIDTGDSIMRAAPGQKLFDPKLKKYIEVEKLTANNTLFGLDRKPHTNLKITKHDRQTPTVKVTVDKPHNLFVGEEPVLAHNFLFVLPVAVPFAATVAAHLGVATAMAPGIIIGGVTIGEGLTLATAGLTIKAVTVKGLFAGTALLLNKAFRGKKIIAIVNATPEIVKAAPQAVATVAKKVLPPVSQGSKDFLRRLLSSGTEIIKQGPDLLTAAAKVGAQTVEHAATAANVLKTVAEPIIQNVAPVIQNLGPAVVENAASVAQTIAPVLQEVSQATASSSISSVISQGTRTAIAYGSQVIKNITANKPVLAGTGAVLGIAAMAQQQVGTLAQPQSATPVPPKEPAKEVPAATPAKGTSSASTKNTTEEKKGSGGGGGGPENDNHKNAPPSAIIVPAQEIKEAKNLRGIQSTNSSRLDISKLDKSVGDLDQLKAAVEKTNGIEGQDQLVKKIAECGKEGSKNGNLGNARGASFEITRAAELKAKGVEITALGKKVVSREFDIITPTKLIECKNIDWNKLTEEVAKDMKGKFGNQAQVAKEVGKSFEVHSCQIIPQSWKNWFNSKNIIWFEGKL